ncbi:hypothetical protein Poli38472_010581 [Pythium oligandrum]|uniref:Uncharacterized protein n=1 Tax=Pythium oligandrum TaxID=41045 RepID=A0A8K1C3E6_PYTOL|nr:hypothetical protein Poli38472_010581 [Pythium oligandrum]|eukprot:TMW55699.1 hypothetical protein Poli38472_010581 [Pythium oligandrum]
MTTTASAVLTPPPTTELDSAEGIETFKYIVTGVVLIITVVSSLVPLWISRNGTSHSRQLLTKKLPFVTAGVFIGSGLLHLLPDAVKMYNKVIVASPEWFTEKWMRDFPTMYLLSTIGCMLVWAVDLINLGDSGKMMAVASAARPNYETSMYRVQIPPVTSLGVRYRSYSVDDSKNNSKRVESCVCDGPPTLTQKASFHKGAKTEETTLVFMQHGIAVVGDSKSAPRSYTLDHGRVASEEDGLLSTQRQDSTSYPETSVSEHVVFSGASPVLPYLLALLFSLHSLIAGFALGVNRTSNKTAIATTVAILSHKVIEAMSVGANFARAKGDIGEQRAIAVLLLYSLMTPFGILFGMLLADALQGTAVLVTESMALSVASGSFVYLAFHEMSEEHGSQDTPSVQKIVLFGAGLFSMAALATWA